MSCPSTAAPSAPNSAHKSRKSAHIRQSWRDSSLGFQVKVLYRTCPRTERSARRCHGPPPAPTPRQTRHTRQSRRDSGHGVQLKVLKTFGVVPSSLRISPVQGLRVALVDVMPLQKKTDTENKNGGKREKEARKTEKDGNETHKKDRRYTCRGTERSARRRHGPRPSPPPRQTRHIHQARFWPWFPGKSP